MTVILSRGDPDKGGVDYQVVFSAGLVCIWDAYKAVSKHYRIVD